MSGAGGGNLPELSFLLRAMGTKLDNITYHKSFRFLFNHKLAPETLGAPLMFKAVAVLIQNEACAKIIGTLCTIFL